MGNNNKNVYEIGKNYMLHRSLSFPLAVVLACVTSYGWHCYHQETALFFAKVPGDRTDICSIRIASQSPPVAALTKFQFQECVILSYNMYFISFYANKI